MQSVYWKWIVIPWNYWQFSYPSIRKVFDVAKEMSSAFYKVRVTQFSSVCCFAWFLFYFAVNLLECYHDTYWKDVHRNWWGRWVISCCSTVRFHFLDGLFSLHFWNMSEKVTARKTILQILQILLFELLCSVTCDMLLSHILLLVLLFPQTFLVSFKTTSVWTHYNT